MSERSPQPRRGLFAPHRVRLDNGLTSVVTPIAHRRQAVLTVYLRTGSRFEEEVDNGLSHFVEHMLFRGTARHPSSHRLATAFEDLGGSLGASTAADHGNLAIAVPVDNLEQVIPLVAEVYRAPLLEGLDLERAIIREEILEDLSDSGELVDGPTLLRRLSFGEHGLGRPITGPVTNVEAFTAEQVQRHHALTYVATGAVVSIAGDVNAEEVTRQVEASFGSIPRGTALTTTPPDPQSSPRFSWARYPGSSQSGIHLGFRCPGSGDSAEPALEMLLRILDDGMATRLYRRLCDSQGLCYDVSASYEAYEDVGLVEIEAGTGHDRAGRVLQEMLHLVNELAESGPTPHELDRARQRAVWHHDALPDDTGDVAEAVGLAQLTYDSVDPDRRIQQLLSVSHQDVLEVAQRVFTSAGRSVAIVASSNQERSKLEKLASSSP